MSHPPVRPRSKSFSVTPRLKLWLDAEDGYKFGVGLCDILQAVERARSMKRAAADLGKSYRYVWGRIKKAEQALGVRLVEAVIGGLSTQRSSLTPEARRLVTAFLSLRRRMAELLCEEFARHFE